MKIKMAAISVVLLGLTACGGGPESKSGSEPPPPPPPPAAMMDMAMSESSSRELALESPATGGAPGDMAPDVKQYIAYSHNLGLRLPVNSIEPVMMGHVAACEAVGPSKCIVTNSWMNRYSDDEASASLQIRAVPDWIEQFLGGIDEQAKSVNGEVTNRSKSAEDLTVRIVDTEAQLRAQRTLQSRLETLLAEREGDLGDLLATERELANVNGRIDSMQSTLAALMQRVEMSRLSVNYETKRNPVSQGALSPLAQAFGDFFYNLAGAIAAVITAFAIGLPWLLLIGLFVWIWLKVIWPRIRRKTPS